MHKIHSPGSASQLNYLDCVIAYIDPQVALAWPLQLPQNIGRFHLNYFRHNPSTDGIMEDWNNGRLGSETGSGFV